MFNLITGVDPLQQSGEIPTARVYDAESLTISELRSRAELPTIMMEEGAPNNGGLAHFIKLSDISIASRTVRFNIHPEYGLQPFQASFLEAFHTRHSLEAPWDWHHTCWQYGEGNIFRSLYQQEHSVRVGNQPVLFDLNDPTVIDPAKAACMMPFATEFDDVYSTISGACSTVGLSAMRVDEIYGTGAIINDIVSAIDTAAVVICDLSGKNPNVMYETGIAHAIGRKVVIIAQDIARDVPFDLRHLRCLQYSSANQSGRDVLRTQLANTLETIINP